MSKSKQNFKVKLYADDPNAVLICKGESYKSESSAEAWSWGEGTTYLSGSSRTKGNYYYFDVKVTPPLPPGVNVYTNRSLHNFAMKNIHDKNLEDRVYLVTLDAFNRCNPKKRENKPSGEALLCIILFFWPALCCLNYTSPFQWCENEWKKQNRVSNDFTFQLATDGDSTPQLVSSTKTHRNIPMSGSRRITMKTVHPDGSITIQERILNDNEPIPNHVY
jgi:hypothetical protein